MTSKVPNANEQDLEVAIAAAEAAFAPGSKWATMTASGRSRCLWKLSELVGEPEHAQAMALLDANCFGRPVGETMKYDIPAASEGLQYFAGWPGKLTGDTLPADDGFFKIVKHEPFGITAAIAAWNGPVSCIFLVFKLLQHGP